jgi:hypothetical protein
LPAPQQERAGSAQQAQRAMHYLVHNGHGALCSLSSAAWLEAAPRGGSSSNLSSM